MNDINNINNPKFIKIKNVKSYNSFMIKNILNNRIQRNQNNNYLKKYLSINESKHNTNDTTEIYTRFDAKGIPIFKGNSKNYHAYFIDKISNNKLADIENIESYKNYNAENNCKFYEYKKINDKNYSSCCCLII